jgi:hypothetical protein
VVKNRLPAWDGLAPEGKEAALKAARERYETEIEEIMAQARAELDNQQEALAEAVQESNANRWAAMRETLGEAGAAVVFAEKVKRTPIEELAELYRAADGWGKTIIGLLVEEPNPTTPQGELNMAEALAYQEITDGEVRRLDNGAEIRDRGRNLASLERRLVELDPLRHAREQGDALNIDLERQLIEQEIDVTTQDATAADDFIRSAQAAQE